MWGQGVGIESEQVRFQYTSTENFLWKQALYGDSFIAGAKETLSILDCMDVGNVAQMFVIEKFTGDAEKPIDQIQSRVLNRSGPINLAPQIVSKDVDQPFSESEYQWLCRCRKSENAILRSLQLPRFHPSRFYYSFRQPVTVLPHRLQFTTNIFDQSLAFGVDQNARGSHYFQTVNISWKRSFNGFNRPMEASVIIGPAFETMFFTYSLERTTRNSGEKTSRTVHIILSETLILLNYGFSLIFRLWENSSKLGE